MTGSDGEPGDGSSERTADSHPSSDAGSTSDHDTVDNDRGTVDDHDTVDDLRERDPGEDPADPYADVDVSSLPAWWREAIAEFERAGLRPYRPPRFTDGALTPVVLEGLSAELGREVRFVCFDGHHGDDWAVQVDGEVVGRVPRRRTTEGYTLFEMDSDEFRALVREAVA